MVMSKRSDRRERRLAREGGEPTRNGSSGNGSSGDGSSVDATPATKADLEASLPLIDALVAQELLTEAQIEKALARDPKTESDLCDAFVVMGFIDEHNLVAVRAEFYVKGIADLRQGEPDPE